MSRKPSTAKPNEKQTSIYEKFKAVIVFAKIFEKMKFNADLLKGMGLLVLFKRS